MTKCSVRGFHIFDMNKGKCVECDVPLTSLTQSTKRLIDETAVALVGEPDG